MQTDSKLNKESFDESEYEIAHDDRTLEWLWDDLEDVLFDEDPDGRLILAEDWEGFRKGTEREEIWHWFDKEHSKGIAYLLGLNDMKKHTNNKPIIIDAPMPPNAAPYVEMFFRLRPKFLADAHAHKVSAKNILSWIRENAPEYEAASKSIGFNSLEDELDFMREAVRQLKDKEELKPSLRLLRGDSDISVETRHKIIGLIGELLDWTDFPEKYRFRAHQLAGSFEIYGMNSPEQIKERIRAPVQSLRQVYRPPD